MAQSNDTKPTSVMILGGVGFFFGMVVLAVALEALGSANTLAILAVAATSLPTVAGFAYAATKVSGVKADTEALRNGELEAKIAAVVERVLTEHGLVKGPVPPPG